MTILTSFDSWSAARVGFDFEPFDRNAKLRVFAVSAVSGPGQASFGKTFFGVKICLITAKCEWPPSFVSKQGPDGQMLSLL